MLFISKQDRDAPEAQVPGCPVPVIDAVAYFKARMAKQRHVHEAFLRGVECHEEGREE